jgi:hypothetical protein
MVMEKLEQGFTSVNIAFKAFDRDRTGTITAREFRAMCTERFGLPISDAILNEIVAHLDSDNSGVVEFAELQQVFGEAIIHSSQGTFLGKLGANKPHKCRTAALPTSNAAIVIPKVRAHLPCCDHAAFYHV